MGLFDRINEVNRRSGLSIALDLAAAVKQRLLAKDHGPRIEAPKPEVLEEHGPAVFFKHGDHAMVVRAPDPVVEAELVEEEIPDVVASFEEIERRRGITWGARLDEAAARRDYRLALDRVRRAEWATKSRPAKFTRETAHGRVSNHLRHLLKRRLIENVNGAWRLVGAIGAVKAQLIKTAPPKLVNMCKKAPKGAETTTNENETAPGAE